MLIVTCTPEEAFSGIINGLIWLFVRDFYSQMRVFFPAANDAGSPLWSDQWIYSNLLSTSNILLLQPSALKLLITCFFFQRDYFLMLPILMLHFQIPLLLMLRRQRPKRFRHLSSRRQHTFLSGTAHILNLGAGPRSHNMRQENCSKVIGFRCFRCILHRRTVRVVSFSSRCKYCFSLAVVAQTIFYHCNSPPVGQFSQKT